MACAVCGAADAEVFTNELLAGKWHSACTHAACEACLRKHIEASLPRCRREMQVRVACYAPGCRKRLPQKMAFRFCRQAEDLAAAIDNRQRYFGEVQDCPLCRRPCTAVVNTACGHAACGTCWLRWCAKQVDGCVREARLHVTCCHPGCGSAVEGGLWTTIAAWEAAGRTLPPLERQSLCEAAARLTDHCEETQRELARLRSFGSTRTEASNAPGPVCPICREHCAALLSDTRSSSCARHAACERCWTRWARERLERCVLDRRVAVPCLAAGCGEDISLRLWQYLAARAEDVGALERGLARRRQLVANELYPAPMQVDCPCSGCVGLGYLGFDTVMCFICEHVWVPGGTSGQAPVTDAENIMGLTVKRCPRCNEYIEKNGGCDHMTCRCKYEFFWSTLLPYKPAGS